MIQVVEAYRDLIGLAEPIVEYMKGKKYPVFTEPGHLNVVYLEGVNSDFTLNNDLADGWNDLRLVIDHSESGQPYLKFRAIATTEPGKAATFDSAAMRLGGVARIAFGQYTAWQMGYHKYSRYGKMHPALVQCAPLPVHRDSNRDGKRTGDPMSWARGINQHSTQPGYKGGQVGNWSAGCLVGQFWPEHLDFIGLCAQDPRYIANKKFIFTSTIIAGDDYLKSIKPTA